jgi:mevalonate kinase
MRFSSCAKWILSGEHTVVRGGKAIAFPLRSYECSIDFEKNNSLIVEHACVESDVVSTGELNYAFKKLLKRAATFTNISLEKIRGKFYVESTIKTKSGLGSSSAICTNIANMFKYFGFCNDAFALAKFLEDCFHNKSSGLDIAVVMENKPIVFQDNKVAEVLETAFWPHLVLTYSGEQSLTSRCTEMVSNFFKKNEKLALELDNMMNKASDLCEFGLKSVDFNKLKDGISLGNEAFKCWGLHSDSLIEHLRMLKSRGAVAAKPIGSGLGGYVVSLWEEKPKLHNDACLTLEKP